jgi:hypothetical protein
MFCLFHKYEEQLVYAGGDKWIDRLACTKCGKIKKERQKLWRTTKMYKSRED